MVVDLNAFWTWWNDLPRETQIALRDAEVVLAALLLAKFAGAVLKALLSARGFDSLVAVPWAPAAPVKGDPRARPSDVVGYLCVASLWAVAAWWLAREHGVSDVANSILWVTGKAWTLAFVIILAMVSGGWLSRAVTLAMQSPGIKTRLDSLLPIPGARGEPLSDSLTKTVSVLFYVVSLMLMALASTDLLHLTATASALAAVWQLAVRLVAAGAALGIGWLGLKWARDFNLQGEADQSSFAAPTLSTTALESRSPAQPLSAERQIQLGLLGAVILFAIAVVADIGGSLIGLCVLFMVFLLILPLREYVPDVWGGFYLLIRNAKTVDLEGRTMNIKQVGLLMTDLTIEGEHLSRRNREVLTAVLKGKSQRGD
ncbi:MAG: hypothetical protein HY318_18460 [Armatimonadetes bacterium]|nr:hypothetical protein [Armatimonadota bacterium]